MKRRSKFTRSDEQPCRRCKTPVDGFNRDTTGLCRWCLRDDGSNLTGDFNAPEPEDRIRRRALTIAPSSAVSETPNG